MVKEIKLEFGKSYRINSSGINFPGEVRYIGEENLPKIGGQWETFFTRLPQDNPEGFLKRFRIPKKSIVSLINNTITSNDKLVCKDIEESEIDYCETKKTPIVKGWLKKVYDIEKKSSPSWLI